MYSDGGWVDGPRDSVLAAVGVVWATVSTDQGPAGWLERKAVMPVFLLRVVRLVE